MSQTSSSETPVTKLARFIVDKRKAFFLVFLAAVLFCGSSIDKVVVNNEIGRASCRERVCLQV